MADKHSAFLKIIYDKLFEVFGTCICPLEHETPFQLMAAVMLSAQCRDERVNQVTKNLFAAAPDAVSMSRLSVDEIEKIIHICGLSGTKSRNLHAASQMVIEKFNNIMPQTMEELTSLPGIGRKSANVLLGNCFDIPGFPVDTHVKRVLNRIGIVDSTSPEKIEEFVNKNMDPALWTNFSHLLIQHGRKVCRAHKPDCSICTLCGICKQKGLKK